MRASWLLLDDTGTPITTGASDTLVKIRRLSDGLLFDWDDETFKNSGWVALESPMVEVDATNLAGWYEKVISELEWSDGGYQIITEFDDGEVKRFGSSEVEVKDGAEVILSDLSKLSVADIIQAYWSRAVVNKETGAFIAYDTNGSTPLVTGTLDITVTQSERVPD